MPYARVYKSGNSQVVRLPKEFRFDTKQVEIFRRGDEVVLRNKPSNESTIFDVLTNLPQDMFAEERVDTPPQQREVN